MDMHFGPAGGRDGRPGGGGAGVGPAGHLDRRRADRGRRRRARRLRAVRQGPAGRRGHRREERLDRRQDPPGPDRRRARPRAGLAQGDGPADEAGGPGRQGRRRRPRPHRQPRGHGPAGRLAVRRPRRDQGLRRRGASTARPWAPRASTASGSAATTPSSRSTTCCSSTRASRRPSRGMSLAKINKAVREELAKGDEDGLAMDDAGPLWDRTPGPGRLRTKSPQDLDGRAEEVRRRPDGRRPHRLHDGVSVTAGGRLIRIDVGMTKYYGGPAACLLVEKGVFYEVRHGQAGRCVLEVNAPASRPASVLVPAR